MNSPSILIIVVEKCVHYLSRWVTYWQYATNKNLNPSLRQNIHKLVKSWHKQHQQDSYEMTLHTNKNKLMIRHGHHTGHME